MAAGKTEACRMQYQCDRPHMAPEHSNVADSKRGRCSASVN